MKMAIAKVETDFDIGSAPITEYMYNVISYELTEEQFNEVHSLARKLEKENENERR